MEKEIICYLAGPFCPYGCYDLDWRDTVKREVEITNFNIKFIDPRIETRQGSISTFVYEDLKWARESDVCFLYDGDNRDVVGGAMEAAQHDCCANKRVILCSEFNTAHPMVQGIARRYYIGLDVGIKYLTLLSKFGLEREFEVAYEMLDQRRKI